MEKSSNGRVFECYVPNYDDLDKLYSMDVCTNDIDMAIRNRNLRSVIDQLLVDTSVPQPPQMSDSELIDNFMGKEYEYDDILREARNKAKDFVKERDKMSKDSN